MTTRSLTSLDGNDLRLDGGAMFGNAPKALWERWTDADEHNRISLTCRGLLVKDGDRNILFETGIGAFFPPDLRARFGVLEPGHALIASLEHLGLTDADLDVVVLSHLHFDHAGGLLATYEESQPHKLLFPNATYITSRTAFERARAPHLRDRASFIPELQELLEASGRLELIDPDSDHSPTLGDGYRFHYSDGHTPGLLMTEITMPSGPVLFCGDLMPGAPWMHLPITMGYDRHPELLVDEKNTRLSALLASSGRLFFTHDPTVALCTVARNDRGRYHPTTPHAAIRDLTD